MSSEDVYGDYKDNTSNGNIMNGNNDIPDDDDDTDIKSGGHISNLLTYFNDSDDNNNNKIRIVDTEERKGKITKYTVYIIESSIFNSSSSVARRYNDFKWLYNILGIEFIGCFIPPLPPSNLFDRYNSEVISQRRYDLERFLNRINESIILSKSQSFELFLCETSEQIFDETKKLNKKELLDRSDFDIITLLNTSFINLCDEEIPSHLTGGGGINKSELDADNTFNLDIPRLREFFIRCDEKFTSLNKISINLFKIFTNITQELNIFNQLLLELYDSEYNDKPQFMLNAKCKERFDIKDFMISWKNFSQLQMNCYYKYFLLILRYEAEDIKSILDTFKRYDNIKIKYKKTKINLKKLKDKYPEKDYSQQEDNLINTQNLLDLICKIILIHQTPKLWNKKIKINIIINIL